MGSGRKTQPSSCFSSAFVFSCQETFFLVSERLSLTIRESQAQRTRELGSQLGFLEIYLFGGTRSISSVSSVSSVSLVSPISSRVVYVGHIGLIWSTQLDHNATDNTLHFGSAALRHNKLNKELASPTRAGGLLLQQQIILIKATRLSMARAPRKHRALARWHDTTIQSSPNGRSCRSRDDCEPLITAK